MGAFSFDLVGLPAGEYGLYLDSCGGQCKLRWIERLDLRGQLDEEWALCMGSAGFSEFERSERIHEGEIASSEALDANIEIFGAHFECMLTIDHGERFRLFSEETAAAFLAEQE